MTTKPSSIDEYLGALNEDQHAALQKVRTVIRTAAPKTKECLSYQLPAFRLNGKLLLGFGATTKHCALYLMSSATVEAHQDELRDFDTSKGTIRFQPDRPPSPSLLRKLVKARIAENHC